MRAYVIANPRAGKGAAGESWERLLAALHARGLDPIGDLTQHPGHATELAAQARSDGFDIVVAAGGDGTVHEVVNGLLGDGPSDDVPELGLVPFGSGCDYVKTFDVPTDVTGAVDRIASSSGRAVDIGEVAYDGGRRLFMNIAEVGIGAEVVDRAARLPRGLGGAIYFVSFWMTLPRYVRSRATVRMDDATWSGDLTNLVVAIGQVFGGGMRVAPEADPSDGLFDVQVHHGSKPDYVVGIPKVYKGTHLPHPRIHEARASAVEVRCEPDALIEADGEVLGRTPATFRVLPAALRVLV